ncbi:MAG: hypothetical protein EP330_02745 [Deltaproteobacteria bacterium]|nr:MAG: hypothetical protein EP330_02745 [Deltaproteobacteria bacterium]
MRPVFAAVLLTACSADPGVGFTLVSTLPARTDGIAVADGSVASAAMDDQLCLLDVGDASVIGDTDLGAGTDRLLDAAGDSVLASQKGLYRVSRALGEPEALGMPDPLDARLYADGAVAVYARDGACGLVWSTAPDAMWLIPESHCDGEVALAVDRATGTAWLADGTRMARVGADGSYLVWPASADRLSFDPATGFVLAGRRGEAWIGAMDGAGVLVWDRSLPGVLVDVDATGWSGLYSLMLGDAGGGLLEIGDTTSGQPVGEFALPDTADVTLSEDGTTMALARPDEVLFYRVDEDDGWLEAPSDDHAAAPEVSMAVVGASTAAGVLGTALLVATITD